MPVFNSIQSFLKPSSGLLTTSPPPRPSPPSQRPIPIEAFPRPAVIRPTSWSGSRSRTHQGPAPSMSPSLTPSVSPGEALQAKSPPASRLHYGHRSVNEFDLEWDSDNPVLSIQLHDLVTPECNAMGVNPSGGLAMIAGRQNYILVDLDQPDRVKAIHSRPIRQAIPELQFNYAVETLAAVAVEKKVEIVDWGPAGDLRCLTKFAFHAKPVTDLSWHEHNTSLLATSGADKYINIWDYRQNLDVPVCQFESMVVGATQAVWDRQDPHTLASAHYGEIRLWDLRYPQRCKKYINAHKEQILALDYSANRRGHLLSSSSDYTVKFWNVWQSCEEPREVINVPHAPVWKMRYTPFGEGVITLCTKALYNESNNLSLWSAHNLDCPVHTFYGHTDRVMEFCWRNINPSNDRNELQLVTWSKDHLLKIWPIGNYIVDKVGSPDEDNDEDETNDIVPVEPNDDRVSRESSVEVLESGVDMNSEEDPTSGSFQLQSTDPMSTSGSLETTSTCSPMKANIDFCSLIPGISENIFRVDPALSVIDNLSREGNSSSPSLRLTGNSSISSDLDQTMASLEEDDTVPELKSSSMKVNRAEFPADPFWQDYVPGSIKTVRSKSMEESVVEVVMDLASSIPAALFAKPQPNNLGEEIKSLTLSSNVNFDRLDLEGKHCVLLAKTVRHLFYLSVDFPDDYPWASPPKFRSLRNTTMPSDQVNPILSRLRRTAQHQTDRRRRCLEMCVRQFEIAIDTYIQGEKGNVGEKYVSPFNVLGGLRDANVPFPRVTGARFCGFDKLVIFTCPQDVHIQVQCQGVDKKIPRNFSTITNKESGSLFQTPSKSRKSAQSMAYERRYSKNRMSSTGSSTSEVDMPLGPTTILSNKNGGALFGAEEKDSRGDVPWTRVKIFNVRKSLPYDMDLAMSYRLMKGPGHELAGMNAGIAKNLHKGVAANAWALVHSAIKFPKLVEKRIQQNPSGRCETNRSLSFKSERPLAKFHMGRQLLEQMIDHLIQHCDIVTAASILCVLDPPHPRPHPQALIRHKGSRSECPHLDTGRDGAMEYEAFNDVDFTSNGNHNLHSHHNSHPYHTHTNPNPQPPTHVYHQYPHSHPHHQHHQRHSSDPNTREGNIAISLVDDRADQKEVDVDDEDWDQAATLIDPTHVRRNDELKKTYRTLLHSAGFYLKATEVGKFIHFCDETITCKTTMEHPCTQCGNLVLGLTCSKCKFKDRHSICAICQTFVKGLSIYCFFCGHGGHMNHVRSWFMRGSLCAAGCGCKCEFTMLAEEFVKR
eukprot:TCALIF_06512-PA protein Name:"Similar to Wdr59 WD repeat-containing protein 59 (Mus musculus)" AED:0.04 eAED:0.04 QI:488/0.87/0.77/1/0.75/0.66/9/0/1274